MIALEQVAILAFNKHHIVDAHVSSFPGFDAKRLLKLATAQRLRLALHDFFNGLGADGTPSLAFAEGGNYSAG
jgi:hypothetical protein